VWGISIDNDREVAHFEDRTCRKSKQQLKPLHADAPQYSPDSASRRPDSPPPFSPRQTRQHPPRALCATTVARARAVSNARRRLPYPLRRRRAPGVQGGSRAAPVGRPRGCCAPTSVLRCLAPCLPPFVHLLAKVLTCGPCAADQVLLATTRARASSRRPHVLPALSSPAVRVPLCTLPPLW